VIELKIAYETPKVTCLCATKGRYELLRSAVSYFILQDYPNKELIIFNNHEVDIKLSDFVKKQGNIHVVNAGEFSSISDVYNTALTYVDSFGEQTSEFIAIWDDDDIYLPWHLSTGIAKLRETSKMAWGPKYQFFVAGDSLDIVTNYCEGRLIVNYEFLKSVGFGTTEGVSKNHPHPKWMREVDLNGGFAESDCDENSYAYYWGHPLRYMPYTHQSNVQTVTKCNDTGDAPLHPGPTFYWYIKENLNKKSLELTYTANEKKQFCEKLDSYEWQQFEEPMKLKNPKLTLIFAGHDVYTPWTEMAIDHFKNLPYPKYHLSHTIPVKNPEALNILTPYHLEKGVDDGFNYLGKDLFLDRMIECLSMVHTKYVWYIMPDHLYTKLPSFVRIQNEYLECMDYWSLDQLKVHPLAAYGDGEKEAQVIHDRNGVVIKYSGGAHYPVSHHGTIYKTSWLIESLKEVKAAGGWSNQDHELHYWIGYGRERGVDKLKYTNEDNNPFRVAEVVNSEIELYSTIKLGKLNGAGVDYLQNKCTHPNRALYESLKEGDEVFLKDYNKA